MTDDLVRFLRARLDEDGAVAQAAARAERADTWTTLPDSYGGVLDGTGRRSLAIGYGDVMAPETAAHIARHDPARVLRGIDAKRRLLEGHSRPHECIELSGSGDHSVVDGKPWQLWEPQHTADNGPCFVVRCLALPYADHPDYREDWRP